MQPRTSLLQLIIIATVSLSIGGLFFQGAVAETKVKPDLPLDEEIYEPPVPSAPKKPTKKAKATQEQTASPSHKDTHNGATGHNSDRDQSLSPATTGTEQNSSTGHASKPEHDTEQHAPMSDINEVAEEEYHEPTGSHDSSAASHAEPKLLEGKVQPTPTAKGSGMTWFVVIFIFLAAAIFIFT